ncbi:MAG: hypothetical protein ACI8TQ_002893 [Planctomycetota bacterium]|jgi:hypothetical protein
MKQSRTNLAGLNSHTAQMGVSAAKTEVCDDGLVSAFSHPSCQATVCQATVFLATVSHGALSRREKFTRVRSLRAPTTISSPMNYSTNDGDGSYSNQTDRNLRASASGAKLPRLIGAGLLSLGLIACGPSSNTQDSTLSLPNGEQPTNVTGQVTLGPIVEDPNSDGKASLIKVVEMRWGRLVNVYDAEDDDGNPQTPPIRNLIYREYLISENIITDGFDYSLDTSPFTEQTDLTILADFDSDETVAGTFETQAERFTRLLAATTVNLGFVAPTGLSTGSFSTPPLIPRNAAVSIKMSDLLDHSSISEQTVRVATGVPATTPFGARVFPDPNFGKVLTENGQFVFHSTRIIVDFTVSETEALSSTVEVNSIGMPSSSNSFLTNAIIRIPTKSGAAIGQFQVVRNVVGHELDFANNGPTDSTVTADVVRTFRSGQSAGNGGSSSGQVDNNNGFLLDVDAPQILGSQAVTISGSPTLLAADSAEGDSPSDIVFLLDYDFVVPNCAQTALPGNILRMRGTNFSDIFAVVTRQSAPTQAGRASDVRVRLLPIPASASLADLRDDFDGVLSGEFQSVFTNGPGVVPNCFFRISPAPNSPPVDFISTQSQISVRFSEPMSPASVTGHETFRIDRVKSADQPTPNQSIAAQISATPDLREFRYTPITPFDHVQGTGGTANDELYLSVLGGARGIVDLAGNALADALPLDIRLTIDPAELTTRSGSIVLTFESIDEDNNSPVALPGDPASGELQPEVRGQFIRDVNAGVLRPRDVTRDSRVVDRNSPLISVMTTTGAPIITPLVPLGSRMMTVWRYADVGFSVLDESTANVDVEGLSFAPFDGQVSTDFFDLFEISLAHSASLPDEYPIPIDDGGGGYAKFQNSGLVNTFVNNVLDDPDNQLTIVHDRDEGYFLSPSQVFTSSTGILMMPYPMNRNGEQVKDFDYYTWRDTAILGEGGDKGFGADLKALVTVGDCDTDIATVYGPGSVRSLGLPLLMEFKCFQDIFASGFNGLDTSFALPTQRFPIFRVFSSGGFLASGATVAINPDGEASASGGLSGTTGKNTKSNDNTVMLGQLDTVIRVSRMHTIWFDTLVGIGAGTPTFLSPIVEPLAADQPSGTSIVLAFRGATDLLSVDTSDSNINLGSSAPNDDHLNALMYDAYGDPMELRAFVGGDGDDCPDSGILTKSFANFKPKYAGFDSTWHSDISDLNGLRFIQARVTFLSNTATGFRPELSTLAIPYSL